MSNQLNEFISDVIYHLKQEYGGNADFYRILATSFDPSTGIETTPRLKYSVDNVIRLPGAQALISSSFGFLNKGGSYDVEERQLIVDGLDLPSDYEPQTGDYVVISNEKYKIHEALQLDYGIGYTLKVKAVEGAPLEEIFEETVAQYITLTQSVEEVIE